MSAAVISMLDYRRDQPAPEQLAIEGVAERIRHRVTSTILAQAEARAKRSVQSGIPIHTAIDRAVSWALASVHPDPTEVA